MADKINGTGKLIISILGVVVSLFLGGIGGAYMFGASASDVKNNTEKISENKELVRTLFATRNDAIDDRVLLHLEPMQHDIDEINRKLDRLLEEGGR